MKKYREFILSLFLTLCFITAFAQGDEASSTFVRGLTPGRARALVGVALSVISLVISWRAKNRPGDRRSATVAVVLASAALVINVLHLLNTSGGFGTGGGKAGVIVGLALGTTSMIISARAMMRSQKNT